LSTVPGINLNDGNTIPQLGFGVFQIERKDTAKAVSEALEIGYRHIDTAQMYGNEKEVGDAIRSSGLDRGEVFVTSKLSNGAHEPGDARDAFDATLSDLGFDYVDLFLIHWPLPTRNDGDFVSTWKTLEEFHSDGRARSIGVSNFQIEHLELLAAETDSVPAVNQIEVHPYLTNEAVCSYGREHGVLTEAWSPIAQGGVLDDSTITQIAEEVGKTTAQVVLRWHVQRGDIVFPKSVTPLAHEGELRAVRLRAGLRRHQRDHRARSGRGRAHRSAPRPVRLRSQLSSTD
jgi:2,5-diketo-D-gluconate reductase A